MRAQLFPTLGYMQSGEGYPWYGLTVGDNSDIYTDFRTLTGDARALVWASSCFSRCLVRR